MSRHADTPSPGSVGKRAGEGATLTATQLAAVYGDGTPVPWAPWSLVDIDVSDGLEHLAAHAAMDVLRDPDNEWYREYAARKVAEYDAFRAARDDRKAAILAVVA